MKNIKTTILFIFTFLLSFSPIFSQDHKPNEEQLTIQNLEARTKEYGNIAHQIWEYAELGYLETKSAGLLQSHLKKEGFIIKSGVAEIPTAFVAEFGSGYPIIGILAEYDALPGISQAAEPERKIIEKGGSGHACGHHLFGTGSVAAAVEVKNWLKRSGIKGTIRLYGTPAEEGGAGKVYMVRAGLLNDVDAVLHWHPGSKNGASAASSLANKSAKFRFYGKASHAASSPQRGRSALDAVEAMNYMANMMREHMQMESRMHYVITSGGEAPNVVPAYAEVFYYVRHPEMQAVRKLFDRLVKTAEGAAIGTETKMEYEVIHGVYNLLPNETLSEVMYKNLQTVGGVEYTKAEEEFAKKIIATFNREGLTPSDAKEIAPYTVSNRGKGGSTDVGDVSWMVPTAGMRSATWVPGTGAHSWQAVAAGGTDIGTKGMMVASKTIALTAIDLFKNPELCEKAKKELAKKRGKDFKYEAMLGDRKPPLDYRQ
jgi:aminobenzoyl-glutamate utilization protein B